MLQLVSDYPWLAVCALAAIVIVACTAIVFVTDYLRTSRQAEIDATLKQEMIHRGMSAADIKTVLEARTDGEAMRMAYGENQAVRVGLGKFQIEVGGPSRQADAPAG